MGNMMLSRKSRYTRGGFTGDVLKLVAGTTFSQVIALLASPILARIYAPDAFGVLALFFSVSSLLGVVACLRYEMAVPLPEKDGDAAALLTACFFSALIVTVISGGLIWLFRDHIAGWLNAPALTPNLRMVPFFVFLMGLYAAFSAWNVRLRRFGLVSVSHASNSLACAFAKLAYGVGVAVSSTSLICAVADASEKSTASKLPPSTPVTDAETESGSV
jgi:lipopolysaccharide exporter